MDGAGGAVVGAGGGENFPAGGRPQSAPEAGAWTARKGTRVCSGAAAPPEDGPVAIDERTRSAARGGSASARATFAR